MAGPFSSWGWGGGWRRGAASHSGPQFTVSQAALPAHTPAMLADVNVTGTVFLFHVALQTQLKGAQTLCPGITHFLITQMK